MSNYRVLLSGNYNKRIIVRFLRLLSHFDWTDFVFLIFYLTKNGHQILNRSIFNHGSNFLLVYLFINFYLNGLIYDESQKIRVFIDFEVFGWVFLDLRFLESLLKVGNLTIWKRFALWTQYQVHQLYKLYNHSDIVEKIRTRHLR